jgi:predicted helicase
VWANIPRRSNKNREYPDIDKRVRDTYIAASTARKTKLYDPYVRFLRWAADRVDENGIIAFVSNSSFIHGRTFDGFRKCVGEEFNDILLLDLKGNARTSGDRRRQEGGNIFEDQIRVGVAVYFLVKRKGVKGCRIRYEAVRDYAKADEKRSFLTGSPIANRAFVDLRPDAEYNWIPLAESDFDSLLPIATKQAKARKRGAHAIFGLYSLGVSTNRDEWLYGRDPTGLKNKVHFLIEQYESHRPGKAVPFDPTIKWSETLKRRAQAGMREAFSASRVRRAAYRPFVAKYLYQSSLLVDRPGASERFFPVGKKNTAICFSDTGSRTAYVVLAVDGVADLHFGSSIDGYQQVPLWYFDATGEAKANVTDWALDEFRKHYQGKRARPTRPLSKEAIFYYVYGVLHDPVYRERYASNLRRKFPRVPLYASFWQWSDWGKELMDLHIGYEQATPFMLKRIDLPPMEEGTIAKAVLRADKDRGLIVIDAVTSLAEVPRSAWGYQLGNQSALEWVLEQHKESKPKDLTVREKFSTYRFADYKEKVIDLVMRVTTVSVRTQEILAAMAGCSR